ncbi:multiple transmembrane domain containing protein [Corynebacterium renale]|uniref:Membrane protein n=1 Tax=Corynebacterium renale TaxID=1724 RepID=A0A2A9DL89_9CORY|nr:YhjD/YihY/BrkB family envelope integrity protein [Corynebacterium renale]PFG27136.1 membrane protein [Corynebacterium renale]SQG64133.1 multiple transmembrane domain containing protein [Corynebacterium renale]SQI24044.1 multiple transmembrane domain containing protein [Corynebacterium renale]STC94398.1 multiple transmembrane domain containing protein [Corynebacterium renale]
MATETRPATYKTDSDGIERSRKDEPGMVDKLRAKWDWFDHIMRMQERYASHGGNQYSAGITYFSVLSIFPILMLVFAVLGYILASRPELLEDIQNSIQDALSGDIGNVVNEVIDMAIEQRGAVAGLGALTTLWSGLGWMNNLRYGVSKMWRLDPTDGNFVAKKLWDLLGLVGLIVSFGVAFGITAVGTSSLTRRLLEMVGLDQVPGIGVIVTLVTLAVGILANFLVMLWMILYLPRTKVPKKSGAQAALLGAIAFEIIKQLGSLFASSALNNPAGAVFGPIIGLMVILYLVWRVVLYVSAWAATTEESMEAAEVPAPAPAVIRVRSEVDQPTVKTGTAIGVGATLGVVGATLAGLFRRK